MVQLPGVFNPNAPGQERAGDFSAFDPGDYNAKILDSKMKATAAGTGEFLEITWEIIDGEMAGRRVWTRLNLVNPSIQAVEIAQKHLASICDAVGVPGPVSDSSVLHDRPCIIKVIKKAATTNYPESNEVKNYSPIGGAVTTAAAASPAAAAVLSQPTVPVAAPVAAALGTAPPVAAMPPAEEPPPVTTRPPWIKG